MASGLSNSRANRELMEPEAVNHNLFLLQNRITALQKNSRVCVIFRDLPNGYWWDED